MKPITAVVIGAGMRGAFAYASYALKCPEELKIVAVAEPQKARRERFARDHGLDAAHCFESWEPLLALPRLADCAFICTQDRMHCAPTLLALERGYHVLCEKPMSPERAEMDAMIAASERTGRALAICHVLRYSPFYGEIKRFLEAGAIGRLESIHHMESVGYYHAAHSFVRGNWRNATETSPMILQKCCHDMDILRWLADAPCERVSSFGSLDWFKPENAPQGAPARCLDGCPQQDTCAYYAPAFYLNQPWEAGGFARAVAETPQELLPALKTGPYGRCVYRCDNDVVDHQVVNLLFQNGVTATHTMCDFTRDFRRNIVLMGTRGQIEGDMKTRVIRLYDFASGNQTETLLPPPQSGHGGSDEALLRAFLQSVRAGGAAALRVTARQARESHLMAYAAERSRLTGRTVPLAEMENA